MKKYLRILEVTTGERWFSIKTDGDRIYSIDGKVNKPMIIRVIKNKQLNSQFYEYYKICFQINNIYIQIKLFEFNF